MIVVFDSGIWISALRFGGTPLAAIDHALLNHRIAVCDEIVDEVCRISLKKFGRGCSATLEALAPYRKDSLNIEIRNSLHDVCRDPKDDMILECAALASADLIVTGDRDLLVLGSYGNARIITPRQHLDAYAPTP